MPTCKPLTTRPRSERRLSTILALGSPALTSWRTREILTATRENSTAAKKALMPTRARTRNRRRASIWENFSKMAGCARDFLDSGALAGYLGRRRTDETAFVTGSGAGDFCGALVLVIGRRRAQRAGAPTGKRITAWRKITAKEISNFRIEIRETATCDIGTWERRLVACARAALLGSFCCDRLRAGSS